MTKKKKILLCRAVGCIPLVVVLILGGEEHPVVVIHTVSGSARVAERECCLAPDSTLHIVSKKHEVENFLQFPVILPAYGQIIFVGFIVDTEGRILNLFKLAILSMVGWERFKFKSNFLKRKRELHSRNLPILPIPKSGWLKALWLPKPAA